MGKPFTIARCAEPFDGIPAPGPMRDGMPYLRYKSLKGSGQSARAVALVVEEYTSVSIWHGAPSRETACRTHKEWDSVLA